MVAFDAPLCDLCDHVLAADGIYRGPRETPPEAVVAVICGVIGLITGPLGLFFGGLAIMQARRARAFVRLHPRYDGDGLAIAAMALGSGAMVTGAVTLAWLLIVRVGVSFV